MKKICIHKGLWTQLEGPQSGEQHDFGPKYGESVTVSQCPHYTDSFAVEEHPYDPCGNITSFNKKWFVDPISEFIGDHVSKEETITA